MERPKDRVLKYLKGVESATLREIYDGARLFYYASEMKHTGEIMSRLVTAGRVTRVQKGIFKWGGVRASIKEIENQTKLF